MSIIQLSTLDLPTLRLIETIQTKYFHLTSRWKDAERYEAFCALYPTILVDAQEYAELLAREDVVEYLANNRGWDMSWDLLGSLAISLNLEKFAEKFPYFSFIPVKYEHKFLRDFQMYNTSRAVENLFELIPDHHVNLLDVLNEMYYLNKNPSYGISAYGRLMRLSKSQSPYIHDTMLWDLFPLDRLDNASAQETLGHFIRATQAVPYDEISLHITPL